MLTPISGLRRPHSELHCGSASLGKPRHSQRKLPDKNHNAPHRHTKAPLPLRTLMRADIHIPLSLPHLTMLFSKKTRRPSPAGLSHEIDTTWTNNTPVPPPSSTHHSPTPDILMEIGTRNTYLHRDLFPQPPTKKKRKCRPSYKSVRHPPTSTLTSNPINIPSPPLHVNIQVTK